MLKNTENNATDWRKQTLKFELEFAFLKSVNYLKL